MITRNLYLSIKLLINKKDFFNLTKEIFRSGMGTMNLSEMFNKMKGFIFLDLILNLINPKLINHQLNLQNQQYFRANYFLIYFSLLKN